jgi:hypothetical protein
MRGCRRQGKRVDRKYVCVAEEIRKGAALGD